MVHGLTALDTGLGDNARRSFSSRKPFLALQTTLHRSIPPGDDHKEPLASAMGSVFMRVVSQRLAQVRRHKSLQFVG